MRKSIHQINQLDRIITNEQTTDGPPKVWLAFFHDFMISSPIIVVIVLLCGTHTRQHRLEAHKASIHRNVVESRRKSPLLLLFCSAETVKNLRAGVQLANLLLLYIRFEHMIQALELNRCEVF